MSAPQTFMSWPDRLTPLSDVDFKQIISDGGTLTISQINARLKGPTINAAVIAALGIASRKDRAAVHIYRNDYPILCTRLTQYIASTRLG